MVRQVKVCVCQKLCDLLVSLVNERREFAFRDLYGRKAGITVVKELDEICVSDIGISGIENASDKCSVVLLYCGAERVTCRVGKSGLTAEIVFISVLGSAYKTVAVCKLSLAAVLVGSTYRVVESLCDLRILCCGNGFVEDKCHIVRRCDIIR